MPKTKTNEDEREVSPIEILDPEAPGALTIPGEGLIDSLRHNIPTGISGDVSSSDIVFPRLKMAYGVGKLAASYNPGDLVLDDQYLIVSKGEPLTLVVGGMFVFWKEYQTPAMWEAQIKPRVFSNEKAVLQIGGTTVWRPGAPPSFSKAAEIRMLIAKPESIVCSHFGIVLDGKEYAAARWAVDKTCFRTVAIPILQAASGGLSARGLLAGRFTVVTQVEKSKTTNNMQPVARARLEGYNTEAFVTAVKVFMTQPVAGSLDGVDVD